MVNGRAPVQARLAMLLSVVEYRANYTWASWLFGWCVRLTFQVVFFSTVGVVVGGPATVEYLLVGNLVAVAALEATTVVAAMAREHYYGTMALLVASPGNPVVALVLGNICWPFAGVLSAGVTAGVTIGVFGISFPAAHLLLALPLTLLCALSAFCFGCAIGAFVLIFPSVNYTAMNVTYLLLMTFTGVNVSVDFWPGPLRWLAEGLPVTHGLLAVRTALADGLTESVMVGAALELLVGALWFGVAATAIRRFVARWRRRGGLDFPS